MSNPEILPLVLKDITDRVQVRGMATYGKPLTAHDGRDSLWDAYEEILDLAVYIRKAIEERNGAGRPRDFRLVCGFCDAVLRSEQRCPHCFPAPDSGCVS